jgi:hypothetical protein
MPGVGELAVTGTASIVGEPVRPALSPERRRRWRARAEADGWRPSERCTCGKPRPVFAGGDLYYLEGVCARCRRRVR